ncbi:MAG: extracellular solute-binding protein [Lachnospiraceae bacterium]|nr:extracellular solute-binding protein [Lachnospiraceae bacterium]
MKKRYKKIITYILCLCLMLTNMTFLTGCGKDEEEDVIVLRVSNWEEYIDEGDWDEEETIELENGTVICSETSMVEDYETWFYETYGKKVVVEYSTFGTNEELYNQLSMGDTYDLVCPSEYMIMKMMAEDMLVPFSEEFYDPTIENNYYAKGVSPYIQSVFDNLSIEGEPISKYAAGYMWGTLGIVYNPEEVTEEEASHWNMLLMDKFDKRVTIKDSVRDAYFAGNSIYNEKLLLSEEFLASEDYYANMEVVLNATDKDTVDAVEDILSDVKKNVYSFETDSGKADMVSGKVVANQQWSGDAVYTLDQAEEEGVILCYSAPEEATNLWFDGWCMLKDGIGEDPDKQLAAEAFVNFMSMPENAIRNMWYIGYTSVISGGEDNSIFQYAEFLYSAEEDEEETVEYPTAYFYTGKFENELTPEEIETYTIVTTPDQTKRQLFAQYPPEDVVKRSVVMDYFGQEGNDRINQMWLNVRCFDLYEYID